MKNYDDIIDLPHHVSKNHPQMSRYNRAAQFAPFSALTGYEESINEAGRYVTNKIELDDSNKEEINFKLNILNNLINQRNQVTFIFFSKDKLKNGGSYKTIKGILKKYDEINNLIILEDKTKIYIDDIFSIKSPIFDNY
ncbi:putative uncharacterized protein [Firmicutes bacterium CAG:449]|nr:putative uncharacterized protein [Firmicutes bacterium CAG:449]